MMQRGALVSFALQKKSTLWSVHAHDSVSELCCSVRCVLVVHVCCTKLVLDTALFVVDDDGQVHVRKDHRNREGQAPLCYVETGYKGIPAPDGEPHQAYMVYNKSDLEWARRLRFHLRRFQP